MVLGYKQGLRWLTGAWSSAWLLVVIGAMDFNSDLDYCGAMDSEIAVDSPDEAMALDTFMATGCILYLGQLCGLWWNMVHTYQYRP